MTVKERLHQLVERLPEELPETAIDATENALGPYLGSSGGVRVNGVPWTPPTPEMMEERAARVRATAGKYAHVRTSSEDYYRRKHEERLLEDEQSDRRLRGEG